RPHHRSPPQGRSGGHGAIAASLDRSGSRTYSVVRGPGRRRDRWRRPRRFPASSAPHCARSSRRWKMRRRRHAPLLLLALGFAFAFSAARAAAQPGPLAGLDAYIERALKAWEVPGLALAIVKDDSVIHARGYGVRELGRPDAVDART